MMILDLYVYVENIHVNICKLILFSKEMEAFFLIEQNNKVITNSTVHFSATKIIERKICF